MRTISLFGLLAVTLTLAGCGGDDDAAEPANTSTGIEIDGSWTASVSGTEIGTEIIDDDGWTVGSSVSVIADYSNAENVAVTRNPDDAEFSPGKYNRIVWTDIADGAFYYCTTDFGLDTVEDAQAAETTPDPSDPDNSGCGGTFPWTKLTRQ
jgi:hypothetical protein